MIFHAYLAAYFFWLALALGALGILMIHNLAGGYWGAVLRRPLEAMAATLPLLAVLFIPILLGMGQLYPWIGGDVTVSPQTGEHAGRVTEGALLGFKQAYLSVPFFIGRAVACFIIWIAFALLLIRWSRQRDEDPSPALTARMRNWSAVGLVLLPLTGTIAAVDWLMSTDPTWTSSIWGLILAMGGMLTAFALATLFVVLRSNSRPFSDVASPALFNTLGSLMLAFLMLWAYMSISQVILFYAGNLPEETIWYFRRTEGLWTIAAIAIVLLGFFAPFSALILRPAKRDPRILAGICALILATQFLNMLWLVLPTWNDNPILSKVLAVVIAAVIGALFVGVFLWQLRRAPEIAPSEPKLAPAIEERAVALAEAREHAEAR